MVKIKEIKLPDPDSSFITHIEYSFDDAQNFYDVLLNHNDILGETSLPYSPEIDGQRRWIFRGHWDSTWGLTPTAFRKESYKKLMPEYSRQNLTFTERDPSRKHHAVIEQISLECNLLRHFMETANNLGIKCNYNLFLYDYMEKIQNEYYQKQYMQKNRIADKDWIDNIFKWPQSEIYPLMSLAQHHGIPTRLLDFSYNPLFAAFFAASRPFLKEYINDGDEIEKNGKLCVWAINEKAKVSRSLKKIQAPSNRSSNIFAQEGSLIMDINANNNFINNGEWYNFKDLVVPNALIKFTLPQRKYKDLLRHLWDNDITPARIMPNIDRVTETLKYMQWINS